MAELEVAHVDGIPTSSQDLRSAWNVFQAGRLDAGDLKVTSGAGLSVDVAAGVVFMPAPSALADLGLYRGRNDAAKNSAAFATGGIQPNATGNPRIDQVIARVYDSNYDGSGLKLWRLEMLTGVATAAATLDNRLGAIAALPAGSVRVADLLIAAGAASVPAGNIRDRLTWARGAFRRILRNANAAAGSDYTIASATYTDLDATNLTSRLECSGVPLELSLLGRGFNGSGSAALGTRFVIDGAVIDGGQENIGFIADANPGHQFPLNMIYPAVPAAGSHIIKPQANASTGTITVYARAADPLVFLLEEIVRPNADNS